MGQMSPAKAFEIVHRYADIALKLDNDSADSHLAKASAYLFYEWKWKEAYDALQKAHKLNPNNTVAHQFLSMYYIIKGQIQKAVITMEEAVLLEPLSTTMNHFLGRVYIFAERYDDAIRVADNLLEIDPQNRSSIELKGWAVGLKGDWKGAKELFKEVYRLTGHPFKGLSPLGFAYGMLGETEKAIECITKIEQRLIEEPESVIDGDLAGIFFSIGDLDKTFHHMEQCVEKRVAPITFYLEYPIYKKLKNDPRYIDLRKKNGL
jgi:tetratricopeptide (TPR) repeat protein